MPNGSMYTNFILTSECGVTRIADYIGSLSKNMSDYVKSRPDSEFVLLSKILNHSDLATFGKATRPNSYKDNLLYYITEDEMRAMEKQSGRPFQTAHQSCIGLKKDFYKLTGLPNPRNYEGHQYLLNDFVKVYLVNDNLEYFTSEYTESVFGKLNKTPRGRDWNFQNLDVELNDRDFLIPIELHCAVHGIGMEQDETFHKLRHHMFKGDTFCLLYERFRDERNLFVMLAKNPTFFSLTGKYNDTYTRYLANEQRNDMIRAALPTNVYSSYTTEVGENIQITRSGQAKWRDMLAQEMMAYTAAENVFCPFTLIEADYNKLGTLFVASHIKWFSDINTLDEEKYDINNGLLLSVTADALFDQHLITVSEDKELMYSYLLRDKPILLSKLCLNQPSIFTPILNEKRMEYIAYHRSVFMEMEEERKCGGGSDERLS